MDLDDINETKPDGPFVITCLRWDGIQPRAKGSIPSQCDRCGEQVSIAPTGQDMLLEHEDGQVRCIHCVLDEVEKDPELLEQFFTNGKLNAPPGAIREIKEELGGEE